MDSLTLSLCAAGRNAIVMAHAWNVEWSAELEATIGLSRRDVVSPWCWEAV